MLKACLNYGGYEAVQLWNKNKPKWCMVHRLVAQAFIPFNGGTQVHHINHDRCDNKVENLEWSTEEDNMIDMWVWSLKKLGYKITPPDR